MPEIDIQKIDMLIKAFNIKLTDAACDDDKKRAELAEFISKQTTAAKKFFAAHSTATKMKRNDHLDPQAQHDPKDLNDTVDCSVIKIMNNGQVELYLMSGHLQSLGEGSSGRAKLAIRIPPDPQLTLYAIKREWTNNDKQQKEAETLKNLKIMVGDKMQRSSTTTKRPKSISTNQAHPNDNSKFYTVMPYLGEWLPTVVWKNRSDEKTKLDLGIQIALKVYNLHTTFRYAHLDLKPDNITVDTSTPDIYKVNLIDFGFSKQLDDPKEFTSVGTAGYLPGVTLKATTMDPAVYQQLQSNYATIGHTGLDVFALKRTLSQEGMDNRIALIDVESLKTVNRVLYEMLSTKDDIAALQRKDTAAMIAANLILHSLNIYPACTLYDENSKEIISLYEEQKTALDLKDKIEAKLKDLYPKIYRAAQILETHLGVKSGKFILDDDLAQKILSLNTSIQDTNVLKNKLQQLFFFTQDLSINIPVAKLSDTKINFPDNYPNTKRLLKQKGNICLCFMEGMLTTLNLDHRRIGFNQYVNMMHVLYTEEDELKKKITLLLIYLEMQIDADVLKSPQKCQSILEVFQKLKGLNLNDQKYLIQKCLVLSNSGMISELDIGDVAANATLSNIQTIISKHNLHPDSIDLKKRIDMLYTLSTENNNSKKNVKLLSIYLEIPIDKEILKSPQKCQSILGILENADWKKQNFLQQQELMKKYLVFSNIEIISEFNIAKLINIENKALENCQQYLQSPHADRFTVQQLEELKVKVNKMLAIQITFSLFFDKNHFPVDAAQLYIMSEPQLDAILKSSTQLLSMMNPQTFLIRHEISEKQVADSKAEIVMQIKDTDKYVVINAVANAYKIPLLGKNITPKRLEEMHKLLAPLYPVPQDNVLPQAAEEKKSKENALVFKSILAYLDLDNIFDDANIIDISEAMNKYYCKYCDNHTEVDYDNLRKEIASQIIVEMIDSNYPEDCDFIRQNYFDIACITVCDHYHQQSQENRPNFHDVLIAGFNAYADFNPRNKTSCTLESFVTAALDAHNFAFTHSQLKAAIEEVRNSDQPQKPSAEDVSNSDQPPSPSAT